MSAPRRDGLLAIDIHCHAIIGEAADLVADVITPEQSELIRWSGERSHAYNAKAHAEVAPLLTDPNLRIREMDRMGVDVDQRDVVVADV